MPQFEVYFGIDYSGAETPTKSLRGLRIYSATRQESPVEIPPPPSRKKYWTRRGLAEYLANELRDGPPTLVGIDHGFSFPLRYFEVHELSPDWPEFLDDFHHHWPTYGDNTRVDFIRHGDVGRGALRCGDPQWLRLTEQRCKAKSVFRFGVNGEVAKSTHSGLPWLRYLRNKTGGRIHVWPFDGWLPKPGLSVIVEVYPSLWNRTFPSDDRDSHQQDAYSIARWMRENDANGSLEDFFDSACSQPSNL